MNRVRYLLRNTGILAISNFASKILVFLLVPLYTSVLTTSEYGIYDLIVSTISLLLPLLTCNVADAVMRFMMDNNYPKEQVISIGLKHTFISVILAWIAIIIIHQIGIFPVFNGFEVITGIYFLFYAFNQLLIQASKGSEKVVDMGIAAVLGTVIMLGGNILLLLAFDCGLLGFFIANVLAQAVPTLYLAVRLQIFKYFRSMFKKYRTVQIEMLKYCVPLIVTVIGWWINSASDRYVVAFICGVSANGLLSVSYKIPTIINTLQAIFTQAWQISAIKEYDSKDKAEFYGKTFSALNIFVTCACSGLILFTKPLAHFLYAKDFYYAWQYVPLLLISCVFNSASGMLGPILSAKKDSKSMALSAVYGASANVVLNILLVTFFGIQGACVATVIASYIIYVVRKKAVGNEISINDYSKIIISWILLCVQAIIEINSFPFWTEIIIFVAVLLLNYSSIRSILLTFLKHKRQ